MSPGSEVEVRLGTEAEEEFCLRGNREDLIRVGRRLDCSPAELGGELATLHLASGSLKVRTREGGIASLLANAVQTEFERRRGLRNIVLKARQMGLTTWVAARFFLRTITHPGTLTLQVAHTQEAAEEIFRIVHRFYQWLSPDLRNGPLKTSRANARQLVFPEMDSQYRLRGAAELFRVFGCSVCQSAAQFVNVEGGSGLGARTKDQAAPSTNGGWEFGNAVDE